MELLLSNNMARWFVLLILMSTNYVSAQWHDTIYFAAPYYNGSYETFAWIEMDTVLLVSSSTRVGWQYSRKGMLTYYLPNGHRIKSVPLPNDFNNLTSSETYYFGTYEGFGYLSHAYSDTDTVTYMNRLYADTVIWKTTGWLKPYSSEIDFFNGKQAWFEDSVNFYRIDLESGDTMQVADRDSLLPDSIQGIAFENYLSTQYTLQKNDTLTRVYSYGYFDPAYGHGVYLIAILKFDLRGLSLISAEGYLYAPGYSGRGYGFFEDELVTVKDSLVPNLADTTTERWIHLEKPWGERVRTIKMNGRLLSGNLTYTPGAQTVVNGKYTLVHEECWFKDTLSNEGCSRILLFGENNKLYYDRYFKGWGYPEHVVTKMSVNEKGEAYFRVTTTGAPNYAYLLVKVDTTGEHELFNLGEDDFEMNPIEVSVHPNPFQNSIQIETTQVGYYQFRLFNLTGQLIIESEFLGKQYFSVNSESIKPGLYLFQLQEKRSGKILRMGKLLKQ